MIFWSANLKFIRKQKGLSQNELADELTISRSKIAHYESGKLINPPIEELIRISEYFKVSIDDLIKYNLSTARIKAKETPDAITGDALRVLAISVDQTGEENVEMLPLKARAGYQAGYKDPEYVGALPKFSLPNLSKNKSYRIFPTHGDSMYPYPENCMVVAEYVKDWSTLENMPCVVILRTQQDFLFKMVTFSNNGFLLRSLNPSYKDLEVTPADILEIWLYKSHMSEDIPVPDSPLESLVNMVNEIKRDVSFLRQQNK